MINPSDLAYLQKDIWSWSMRKTMIKLEWGNYIICGMDLYIIKCVLQKVSYEIIDYDGIPLSEPRNRLYVKKYYA
jgi:hypothetical protein